MDAGRTDELTERQHGLLTYGQARELGFSEKAIEHRRRGGRWRPIARGVYRIAGAPPSPRQRALAAVLAAGSGAALSHESAAALLGLPGFALEPLVVTVARHGRRSLAGVRIEQSLEMPTHHVTVIDGIPCTTVARTLFDLCGKRKSWGRVARAMDTALAKRSVTKAALWRVLIDLAEHGRDGTVMFRTLLQERSGDYVPLASEHERLFIGVARRHGLPEPDRQVDLGDEDGWIGRVDFLFRGARIVVEVDGGEFHDGLLDRQSDEQRDARLQAAGWYVLRFRWADVVDHPHDVAHSIRCALNPREGV
jgi:predicted transcriptional regulator of viral defense system